MPVSNSPPPQVSKPPTNSVRGRVTSKQAYTHARYTCQYIIFRPQVSKPPANSVHGRETLDQACTHASINFFAHRCPSPQRIAFQTLVFWFFGGFKTLDYWFFGFLELWIIGLLDYCLYIIHHSPKIQKSKVPKLQKTNKPKFQSSKKPNFGNFQ